MSKSVSAGSVAPSTRKYIVTEIHEHTTLRAGDVVSMTETPSPCENMLYRFEDATLHELEDGNGQYVHLDECLPPSEQAQKEEIRG